MVGQHVATRRALSKGLQGRGLTAGEASTDAAGSQGRTGLQRVGGAAAGTLKAAGAATKFGLASTIGAPVYLPRAYGAAKKVMAAKKVAMTARLDQAKAHAGKKRDDAAAFGREYAHNLGVAAKVTGVSKAAHVAAYKSRPAILAGAMWMGGPKDQDESGPARPRAAAHTTGRISSQELPKRTPSPGTGSGKPSGSRVGSPSGSANGARTIPAPAASASPAHVEVNRRVSQAEADAVATQEYRQQLLERMRARGHGRRPAPVRVGADA